MGRKPTYPNPMDRDGPKITAKQYAMIQGMMAGGDPVSRTRFYETQKLLLDCDPRLKEGFVQGTIKHTVVQYLMEEFDRAEQAEIFDNLESGEITMDRIKDGARRHRRAKDRRRFLPRNPEDAVEQMMDAGFDPDQIREVIRRLEEEL